MQENYDFDLVCIGSGPAGQRAAVQAAKRRRNVAVIERRRIFGGVCCDTGTIPSKTFREAVLHFASPDNPFDSRGPVRSDRRPSADQLLGRVDSVIQQECGVIESQLRRNDVELLVGEASFKDPHTLVVRNDEGWREITAANVLVAVGTKPTQPPGVVSDGETILISDEIVSLKRIPKTLTVIGAGVIGIEYASMFAALGVEVIMVDKRQRPLEFLDEEIVDELIHQMRNRNVVFRPGDAVERLEQRPGPPQQVVVYLESGKRIVSDMAFFSVGRMGATGALNLPAAGLAPDERGRLVVDECFRTAVPHIFAAGDVIGYPSLAATSSEQGRLAACYALDIPCNPMPTTFPIGVYAIPEVSMVGATEQELTAQKVPYEVGVARYREIARGQILSDDSGFFKMLFHREDRRLLGVHIIGTGATELIHIGQAVLRLGGGLDYFLDNIFNYPTLAECYKVAALNALNKLTV